MKHSNLEFSREDFLNTTPSERVALSIRLNKFARKLAAAKQKKDQENGQRTK